MTDPSNYGDSTHDLPQELCEALAFYDELVQNTGNRQQSRQVTLEKYSAWIDRLQQHFDTEDRLLGLAKPDSHATDWAAPPEFFGNTQQAMANTRFVPRYRLGVGGQGEVWLAHDPELDRFVALKVIKETERGSQQTAARFWRETEMTGKLEHPNIVPVYEAGRASEGQQTSPYYVMRVFGNRHLLRAITAFHSRERQPHDWQLLHAVHEFQQQRSPESERHLEQALTKFFFDENQQCDLDLKEAINALRQETGQQSGRSLQAAIQAYHAGERSNEAFRDLLNRFIDVCNAMAYAHSRGVIHRDLKPQNVMLGEFGETLVVDWGLAKVIGRRERQLEESRDGTVRMTADESSESKSKTKVGEVLGTPNYMSPEQAQGKIDDLTNATDIYGLGGILYAILTGQPPHAGNSQQEVVDRACAGQIVPPSELQTKVSKALEAICLKALSHATNDRYAVAKDLAADITRWLADEPVSAYPDPLVIRAKRWVKAHQAVVGSTAAGVLMALIASTTIAVLLQNHATELFQANQRAHAARILAEQNENLAREQSQLALSTLQDVIQNVQGVIGTSDEHGNVQHGLLATSLVRLDNLPAEFVDGVDIARNMLRALMQMGDIVLYLNPPVESHSYLGLSVPSQLSESQHSRLRLALEYYSEAHEVALTLAPTGETDDLVQECLLASSGRLGDVHFVLGDLDQAHLCYDDAYAAVQLLIDKRPDAIRHQEQLALVCTRLANVRMQDEEASNATSFLQQAIDIWQQLVSAEPTNAEYLQGLATTLYTNGSFQARLQETSLSSSLYQQSLRTIEKLLETEPAESSHKWAVVLVCRRLGHLHRLENSNEAMAYYERAYQMCDELCAMDPLNVDSLKELQIVCLDIGFCLSVFLDHPSGSVPYLERAVAIGESLVALAPQSFEEKRSLLRARDELERARQSAGYSDFMLSMDRSSYDYCLSKVERDPQSFDARRELSLCCVRLGDVELRLEDTSEALWYYGQAYDINRSLATQFPSVMQAQHEFAVVVERIGYARLLEGDIEEAEASFEQLFDVRSRMTIEEWETMQEW